MARPPKDENHSEQSEPVIKNKRYRFELSRSQFFLYGCGLIVALCWIFAFGVLVGRGIPLVQSADNSFRAEFLRFLGLGREVPPPPGNVAETWDNQKKMLESLNYYQDLTRKTVPLPLASSGASPVNSPASLAKKTPVEAQNPKAKTTPTTPPLSEMPVSPQTLKPPPGQKAPSPENGAQENLGEHFTLLVMSLRDTENAQRLAEQLKAKGYPSRIEGLDLSGSGRWNRVLIGSFQNRAEALRFAAEFNRKEKMEGLVIRESH